MAWGCNHEWVRTTKITEKGVLWAKKAHPQHECRKCGKFEMCNQDEVNPDYSVSVDYGAYNSQRFKCSKCGHENEGWFDNSW